MSAQRIGDQEVINQLPPSLQQWLTWERFHLHKAEVFQNRSRDPTFDTRYLPQNCDAFRLPCFWVRRKHLQIYGRQDTEADEPGLFSGHGQNERVLFPVHPASLEHCRAFLASVGAENAARKGWCIWAVPTSSTRTLLAWPDQEPGKALFIKTSLQSPIFGDRRLYPKMVGRSVGLSRLVQESRVSLPATLDYLYESLGYIPRRLPDSGVVIRSIPKEIKEGRTLAAPLFSLLGGSGSHGPLFLTLLERNGMQARQFLEEVLCAPFARLWLAMSMHCGLLLEAHGQDLMLALGPNLAFQGRFFYRDFEGLQVDWGLRLARGLRTPDNMPRASSWRETYETWGYPHGDLVWYKLQTSLFHYLYFVLNELELSLRQWHERGLTHGPTFAEGEVTMMFSVNLMKAIEDMFGVRVGAEYNIYRHLNRFLIFLVKLRREIIGAQSPALPQ